MKITNYIFLSIFLLYSIDLYSQCQIHIETISLSSLNGNTEQPKAIDIYKITNNSSEDYLTWVLLVPKGDKSNVRLTYDFFKARKGDFNFLTMMYENLLDGQPVSIGYSFIKNISSGDTFSYFIVKADEKSSFYPERIVTIKRKEVEQYLRMQIDDKYFSKLPCVFLIEQ